MIILYCESLLLTSLCQIKLLIVTCWQQRTSLKPHMVVCTYNFDLCNWGRSIVSSNPAWVVNKKKLGVTSQKEQNGQRCDSSGMHACVCIALIPELGMQRPGGSLSSRPFKATKRLSQKKKPSVFETKLLYAFESKYTYKSIFSKSVCMCVCVLCHIGNQVLPHIVGSREI